MELVWTTQDFTILGQPYPGFPILLWPSMESCVPANRFLRYYLMRGDIGSKRSWPSTGRALYDFFSFLEAHDLSWQDVRCGEESSLVAAYRDYCLDRIALARSTVRQRLLYVCAFYEYALSQGWVDSLPFHYAVRTARREAVIPFPCRCIWREEKRARCHSQKASRLAEVFVQGRDSVPFVGSCRQPAPSDDDPFRAPIRAPP